MSVSSSYRISIKSISRSLDCATFGGASRGIFAHNRVSFFYHTDCNTKIAPNYSCHTWEKISRGGDSTIARNSSSASNNDRKSARTMRYRVLLAVGSNLGDRFQNIAKAIDMLCDPSFDESSDGSSRLIRTSFLHSTSPMYVSDQPPFLNGAVEIQTDLTPLCLLRRLKKIERHLGRDLENGIRNGPRPIDLDILFYDDISSTEGEESPIIVDDPDLIIPHPLMQERSFVLTPLKELAGDQYTHPTLNLSIGNLLDRLRATAGNDDDCIRVLPLPRGRFLWFNETIVMGILNLTPDSFSDGGKWNESVDAAVEHSLQMTSQGAGIIDMGGESTRPGAKEIAVEQQIQRTIPVIKKLRQVSDVPISIDTRHADVARAAIEAGADIVNDVSGGRFDPKMLSTVSELRVPMILMHMRGTPESMQSMTEYENGDVSAAVINSLLNTSNQAEEAGIHRWVQVVDPGIGFAKDQNGNLKLLKQTATTMREQLRGLPLLLGTSRKGFIGKITGEANAAERDFASVASCIVALCLGSPSPSDLGCNILRVHNVKGTKQATLIMDAISKVR
eukprot:scaffold24028_cov152-Cylindrotheca_fusiformis.AAC.11